MMTCVLDGVMTVEKSTPTSPANIARVSMRISVEDDVHFRWRHNR